MSRTRIYHIWDGIVQRCTNFNDSTYKDYGGRGIKVCPEWQTFKGFYADNGESYSKHVEEFGEDNTTADRWPNNDGNYEKSNFRWATIKEQCGNKRDTSKSSDLNEHNRKRNIIMSKIRNCLIRDQKSSYVFSRYVGCSPEEFKEYIKSLLQEGMTWHNYGRCKLGKKIWQLGHIKDCNKFDLTKEEDCVECFHYTNLAPSWWKENQSKRLLDFIN
jgi:hypothetical protein